MRLLLINYEYPPVGGGASNATWEISRALVKLGHEPVVLTARYRHREPDTANPGIRVIEVPAIRRRKDRCNVFEMASFVLSATWRIRRLLREERIEGMIAFFSMPCGPIAWWGWRGTKVPYIVSLRGGDVPGNEPGLAWFHRLLRPLRHAVFRHSRAVVANSQSLKEASERADPFPVLVIPNGVDTDFWHPPEHRPAPPPFRFLFVGRFQEQKNLPWLIRQLSELKRLPHFPDWEIHFVGDGPQFGQIRTLCNTLGIASRAQWHRWLEHSELRQMYQQCHLLINPALYEGMSNVVLEALACGMHVAISRAAAGGEPVFSSQNVLTFDLTDTRSVFARFIITPKLAVSLESDLTWERCASEYSTLMLQNGDETTGEGRSQHEAI
ncbi:glycosyltransferase family 4 protein [Opitutaceae bacterium EW11]|nr:glycosyltransferase family 4 protein [Opitutaceae bacterium EW11]